MFLHDSSLKTPSICAELPTVTTSYISTRILLGGCEKSRCHVCRWFPLCFGFLLLADANNADRTLCKYL